VALVAGGHTFGKAHGAAPDSHVEAEPEGAAVENMGFGWNSSYGSGKGRDTITSGIEGAWTANPTQWDNGYFDLLLGYDWELTKSPAGANIWHAVNQTNDHMAPDAEDSSIKVPTMMTTADIAMIEDPEYKKISVRFHENPSEFADAFARAWFKLLHRDMGPKSRYMGPEIPEEDLIWQDPVPEGNSDYDLNILKEKILASGLNNQEMIETAWASASTYRGTDMRGGGNGARIRLEPQKNWEVNKPKSLSKILDAYETISSETGASIADIIIYAGNLAIEKSSGVEVPFLKGRGDATQENTDINTFDVLEPFSDGFRNFHKDGIEVPAEEMLLDKAHMLELTATEMVVLIGGLRSLGISSNGYGLFTNDFNALSNDYFKTLLDMSVKWSPNGTDNSFVATDRISGKQMRDASKIDLILGSNSQLRAIVEVYASDDAEEKFKCDFIDAWNKVMNADRFDLENI
jgi:catalase-peroxidase